MADEIAVGEAAATVGLAGGAVVGVGVAGTGVDEGVRAGDEDGRALGDGVEADGWHADVPSIRIPALDVTRRATRARRERSFPGWR